jgi:ribosomal protein S12 methylthiotransferase accessory factor
MSALDSVSSKYVGIVRHVDELLAAPDDSRLRHVVAVGTAVTAGRPAGGGSGYADRGSAALAAALAETVERYAAAEPPDRGIVLATAAELPGAVDPALFSLFAPWQYAEPGFPFGPFTRHSRIRWVEGRSLRDGRFVHLPAQLVYLAPSGLEEDSVGYATSNGLACGETCADAALAGLLELLERDAFLIVWRARLSLPLLDASADARLRAYERRWLEPTGLRHRVVDLSCVHRVPTALAVVDDAAGSVSVGAAAAPDVDIAYRKSLAEAYAAHSAARAMRGSPVDAEAIETFTDHIRFYAQPANRCRMSFLVASTARRAVSDIGSLDGTTSAERLALLVERLGAAGIETYAVDVSTADVREAGLHVVRVIAPRLCPLDVREDACFLGADRLRSVPAALGLRPHPLGDADLNRDPHPFP